MWYKRRRVPTKEELEIAHEWALHGVSYSALEQRGAWYERAASWFFNRPWLFGLSGPAIVVLGGSTFAFFVSSPLVFCGLLCALLVVLVHVISFLQTIGLSRKRCALALALRIVKERRERRERASSRKKTPGARVIDLAEVRKKGSR